jgi:hypothetical protein
MRRRACAMKEGAYSSSPASFSHPYTNSLGGGGGGPGSGRARGTSDSRARAPEAAAAARPAALMESSAAASRR